MNPFAVIMAGGRGERFWPLSTPQIPKPFLKLTGDKSMLQSSVERIRPLFGEDNILLVMERSHLCRAKEQLPYIPDKNYIIEPMGRDTAACLGLASIYLERLEPAAIMVVLAADHYIPQEQEFLRALEAGIDLLKENDFVITLGIEPIRPEIGYGYIEKGKEIPSPNGFKAYKVVRFVEKPDRKTAERYIASGEYYWNSGMFLWRN
ncbi:TPA: mannose-1-phosphate guanylyltransferase, partial [bacterium]|nr:mannose-1-phosphate guanylyltransferase [bacterium]